MIKQNKYRTHSCADLSAKDIDKVVTVSGWIQSIRDHGGVTFIDLRDHYGVLQLVTNENEQIKDLSKESVICACGKVRKRDDVNINKNLATGEIEIEIQKLDILNKCTRTLPFEIDESNKVKDDLRLKYRFLDLRNTINHNKITLRSEVLKFTRDKMHSLLFTEVQTPILTTSSPEGARDFLVPSRLNPGKFYSLPQAPQQYKELLMCSGYDKYFQIAPCFRDEDARADRSPTDFYQMDMEMSFATQDDVMSTIEEVLVSIFEKFGNYKKEVFPKIPYLEAMDKYCSDKPDLRNPLICHDLCELFKDTTFPIFKDKTVKAICAPCGSMPRRWFDSIVKHVMDHEGKGLGYIKYDEEENVSGAPVKFFSEKELKDLKEKTGAKANDVIFFIADTKKVAIRLANILRIKLGEELNLIDESKFAFCWIVDMPFFEENEETGGLDFGHNPFGMPQCDIKEIDKIDPLTIKAYQYDVVLNGVELGSGGERNCNPEQMKKVFSMVGHDESVVENKFPALYNAFHYGAPPHAGCAFGFDRVMMFLCNDSAIKEVMAFPTNGKGQELLMNSPGTVTEHQLRELNIKLRKEFK